MSDAELSVTAAVFALLLAYLMGSIPVGLILGQRRGVDVRTQGSGNIGAANVARSLGAKIGVLVLLLDACKGAMPIIIARWLGVGAESHPWLFVACALGPIAGHCFSIWLRFRGGKGVATALGVFLTLDPVSTLMSVTVFAAVYAVSRLVSLGSIAGCSILPLFMWCFGRPQAVIYTAIIGAAIIVFQHRDNIRRVLRSEEYTL